MNDYPKNGNEFTTERTIQEDFRWKPYKPDGARQMGVPGRWQKRVWYGDFFKWENCECPVGAVISGDKAADDLADALRTLNEAAYAAIRAGNDTTMFPDLNRQKLREIARLTKEMVEKPMCVIGDD